MLDNCLLDDKLLDNACDLYLTPDLPGALYFNDEVIFGGDCCSCNLANLSSMNILQGAERQIDTFDRQRYDGRVVFNDKFREKKLIFNGIICSCNQCDLYKKVDSLKCKIKKCGKLKYVCCVGNCEPKRVLAKMLATGDTPNAYLTIDGTTSTWTGTQLDIDFTANTPLVDYKLVWGGSTGETYDIYYSDDGINYTLLDTNTQGYNNGITSGSLTGTYRYVRIIFASPVSVREVYFYKMETPSCETITREWDVIWTNSSSFIADEEYSSCRGAYLDISLEFTCYNPSAIDPQININELTGISSNATIYHQNSSCGEAPVDIYMLFDTAVVSEIKIMYAGKTITIDGPINSGDIVHIDSSVGKVYINNIPVLFSGQVPYVNTTTAFDFFINGIYTVNITIQSHNVYT